MSMWRLSAGTAAVIGRKKLKVDVLPTTAYIMLGEKCRNNCLFCAQAQSSTARSDRLSRVTWPEVRSSEAAKFIGDAFRAGRLKRACLQVVRSDQSLQKAVDALTLLKQESTIPVCISAGLETVEQAKAMLAFGADRISLALDAATPEIYSQVKGGSWQRRWELLSDCAALLPGRVSTHLIVGLGETEEKMVTRIADCLQRGIHVGLFAFTPVKGTPLMECKPPDIGHYRRIQIAYYLLKEGYGLENFNFAAGKLVRLNIGAAEVIPILASGKAFETSGCDHCNRPYYNERPGSNLYNYPRPLTTDETRRALAESGLITPPAKQEGVEVGAGEMAST